MSTPANSLAAFRSYSYYHVLLMCDSTDTADMFTNTSDLTVWEHAASGDTARIQNLPDLGPYSPKCIGDTGKYCVLINGSTDGAYVITNAKWTTATAAHASPGDKGGSIAIEGSLSVSEPKGVAFLDQIVQCSIALGVDSSQCVYVLKTFFVGHLDGGGPLTSGGDTPVEHITDIDPLMFIVYDVSGTFTEQGGSYEMSFVSVTNGATRMPQYSKAVNGMQITAGLSLKDTIGRLQDNINQNYDRYFNCVTEQIAHMQGVDTSRMVQSLRKVKYKIALGAAYQDPKYTVTDQPTQFKQEAGCDKPAQIQFPSGTSIESAINIIMQMSPQVKEDMAVGSTDANKRKYEFKVYTSLNSKTVGGGACSDSQAYDYEVLYFIDRFMTPKELVYDKDFEILQQDNADQILAENKNNDENITRLRNSVITFEYIYTGKNIDILEFDMKLNYGLAYLQTATLANTFKSQTENTANRQTVASNSDVATSAVRFGGKDVQIPIFFGSQIRTPVSTNTANANNSAQSAFTLAKHASIEVAEAVMKITGNDQLLQHTNRTSSAAQLRNRVDGVIPQPSSGGTRTNFQEWSYFPSFAKVRIKMPRNNDDFALFTGEGVDQKDADLDYAADFWYDGYYYIYGIEHEFLGGDFTQTLQMIALPKKSAFDSTASKNQTDAQVNADIGNCYDNITPCGPATGGTGSTAAPSAPATNKADADTTNSKHEDDGDLSKIPGWNGAKPEVKNAILNAANKYGVSPVTLAKIAAVESGFNPSPKQDTSRSSAKGLFQFIDSTWVSYVKKDPTIGVDPRQSDSAILQARYDPQANANAGASYLKDNSKSVGSEDVGDLYLAHFAGTSRAKAVVAADREGRGNTKLKDLIGADGFASLRKSNPDIIKRDDFTVGELRAWAAKKMSSSVTDSGTQKSTATNTPSTASAPVSTPSTKRTAADRVGASKDCKVEDRKKPEETKNCGPRSQDKGRTTNPPNPATPAVLSKVKL